MVCISLFCSSAGRQCAVFFGFAHACLARYVFRFHCAVCWVCLHFKMYSFCCFYSDSHAVHSSCTNCVFVSHFSLLFVIHTCLFPRPPPHMSLGQFSCSNNPAACLNKPRIIPKYQAVK